MTFGSSSRLVRVPWPVRRGANEHAQTAPSTLYRCHCSHVAPASQSRIAGRAGVTACPCVTCELLGVIIAATQHRRDHNMIPRRPQYDCTRMITHESDTWSGTAIQMPKRRRRESLKRRRSESVKNTLKRLSVARCLPWIYSSSFQTCACSSQLPEVGTGPVSLTGLHDAAGN
jgi:hypothetical protein